MPPTVLLSLEQIAELATRVFRAAGCDEPNTSALVRTVTAAERDRARSHGLFRVPGYVASLRSGKANGEAAPTAVRRTPALVEVDADMGCAPLALEVGIPPLAEAAAEVGIAALVIRRAHHYAALWPEVEAIAAAGLVGLAMTSNIPMVAPHGGTAPIFSTNPIAFAFPRQGAPPVVIDMATSAMAMGEVQVAARDGRSVPAGTGITADGEPTTDPARIATLLPFGGYKGSAIALMVELLVAGAIGAPFSFEAGERTPSGEIADGGELLLALSPAVIAGGGWAEHVESFLSRFAAIEGARLPGARRLANRRDNGPRQVDAALVETIRGLC